jgi:thymidylate synthase (FAD)
MLIDRGHESVLEHEKITMRFIIDRGVSHELCRHRLNAISQESTRYVNYKNRGVEFIDIKPFMTEDQYPVWLKAMEDAEHRYLELISHGATPQFARSVLPNSLKTELVFTANLRQWRHVLKLRTSEAAQPQMREVMNQALSMLKAKMPVVFDDIGPETLITQEKPNESEAKETVTPEQPVLNIGAERDRKDHVKESGHKGPVATRVQPVHRRLRRRGGKQRRKD